MQSSDQGKISPIKNLDPGYKWFYRRYECDYPLYNDVYTVIDYYTVIPESLSKILCQAWEELTAH